MPYPFDRVRKQIVKCDPYFMLSRTAHYSSPQSHTITSNPAQPADRLAPLQIQNNAHNVMASSSRLFVDGLLLLSKVSVDSSCTFRQLVDCLDLVDSRLCGCAERCIITSNADQTRSERRVARKH